MEQHHLSIQGLTKSYDSFSFGPLDLDVHPGSVTAIVGPNGAGKTTLFRLLMNLLKPDQGRVTYHGFDHESDEVELKRNISYAPEELAGCNHLSPEELGHFVAHWYPSWNQEKYDDLLTTFQVSLQQKHGKLSKGARKKVSLALALACGTPILLLDEPTAGLDLFSQRHLFEELVRHMEDEGRMIVIATHVIDDLRKLADYIVLLNQGKVTGTYEKDELLSRWQILWVEGSVQLPEEIPGVVQVKPGYMQQLLTNDEELTTTYLHDQDIQVLERQGMDLDEILEILMARSKYELQMELQMVDKNRK